MANSDIVKKITRKLRSNPIIAILIVIIPAILILLEIYKNASEIFVSSDKKSDKDTISVTNIKNQEVRIDSSNVGTVVMGDQNNYEK